MLSRVSEQIPRADGLVYEPKWDGFRALCFVDGPSAHLQSRNGQPLERYFPEVVRILLDALPPSVVDAEIVIAGDGGLDFDGLQMRIHPAASRVKMLSEQMPASVVAFDMLALGDVDLRERTLTERREALSGALRASESCFVTPQTSDPDVAQGWFERFEGAGLDGVVAKRADQRYAHGERVMWKIKHKRTADCVVGGYRVHKNGGVGSLLLGLYANGRMQFAGFTSSFKASERRELLEMLQPLRSDDSFTPERSPSMPSRWNNKKDDPWVPLRPELVCEVAFDHLQGDRFRHGTRFLRWRTDKNPEDCDYEQIAMPAPFSLQDIRRLSGNGP